MLASVHYMLHNQRHPTLLIRPARSGRVSLPVVKRHVELGLVWVEETFARLAVLWGEFRTLVDHIDIVVVPGNSDQRVFAPGNTLVLPPELWVETHIALVRHMTQGTPGSTGQRAFVVEGTPVLPPELWVETHIVSEDAAAEG
jgi:hypothetical protein